MRPDRYEPSLPGRRRLSGFIQKRGSKLGLPTWGGFLFGSAFVAVGTFIVLIGTKILPIDPSTVHAPYWVLTAAGISFALGGLMVWGMSGRQLLANRRRTQAIRQYPNEPALADYPWHPDGFTVSEWTGAAKAVALALRLENRCGYQADHAEPLKRQQPRCGCRTRPEEGTPRMAHINTAGVCV
jgi:hypothetical protein